MSQIKLKHSGGNSVIIAAPDSNPASDRTLKLPSDGDGTILTTNSATGKILQVQKVIKLDTASQAVTAGSSWSYNPSNFRVTITPSSASNKIVLIGQITVGISVVGNIGVSLDQDGSELDTTRAAADGNRSRATVTSGPPSDSARPICYSVVMEVDAGSTSERYYNYRIRHGSGSTRTLYINRSGDDSNNVYHFRAASSLFAIEVAA